MKIVPRAVTGVLNQTGTSPATVNAFILPCTLSRVVPAVAKWSFARLGSARAALVEKDGQHKYRPNNFSTRSAVAEHVVISG